MENAVMRAGVDTSTIMGWGVDADPRNDPTYPMRDRSGQPEPRNDWQRPVPQGTDIEVLQSTEYNSRPAVFGTGPAPVGASGMIRRAAFRFSENNWWHWLLLIGADRVNMLEGVAADLAHGRVPNIPAEMGVRAEWQHNRASLLTKVTAAAGIAIAITIGVSKYRSNAALPRERRSRVRHDPNLPLA